MADHQYLVRIGPRWQKKLGLDRAIKGAVEPPVQRVAADPGQLEPLVETKGEAAAVKGKRKPRGGQI